MSIEDNERFTPVRHLSRNSALPDDDMNDISAPGFGFGICKENPMTDLGKRIQFAKMLCLTVLPILGLWGFSLFILTDTINKKTENEKTKQELKLSLELGNFIHCLQKERDMSVLYLSALGPETKTFLLQEYIGTDDAVDSISIWPINLDQEKRNEFGSKESLRDYLIRHRQLLTKAMYDLQDEIDFYTNIIQVVITWLYKSITHGKNAEVWKTLVAYLKLTSGKQDVGIERALGTLFYVQGGFESRMYFEMYNNVIHTFRAFYTTAELYSNRVDRLYTSGVDEVGGDLIGIINKFRYEIQHHEGTVLSRDIQRARYWFDNMTLYLDTLLEIQQDLGYEIIGKVDVVIFDSNQELAISATFLVIVLAMCVLVIFATESLTSSIQKHALVLINQTRELSIEQKKTKTLMCHILPKPVLESLDTSTNLDTKYFKSASVLFLSICNLNRIVQTVNVNLVLEMMNAVYSTIDSLTENFEVYKLDTTRDRFMLISGIKSGKKFHHVTEIADLALGLLHVMTKNPTILPNYGKVEVQMGIHAGPCMAGIVGKAKPKYCLLGKTVEQAARLMECSKPNHIRISSATNRVLQNYENYQIRRTSKVSGKKDANGYWLYGKVPDFVNSCHGSDEEEYTSHISGKYLNNDLPGEITQYNANSTRTSTTLPSSERASGSSGSTKLSPFNSRSQSAVVLTSNYDIPEGKVKRQSVKKKDTLGKGKMVSYNVNN